MAAIVVVKRLGSVSSWMHHLGHRALFMATCDSSDSLLECFVDWCRVCPSTATPPPTPLPGPCWCPPSKGPCTATPPPGSPASLPNQTLSSRTPCSPPPVAAPTHGCR